MSQMLPLSVTIITRNEEGRIRAAIESVKPFAAEIIVVDSGSSDNTAVVARGLGAKVVIEPFRGFGQQKNFAQSLATQEWVLNIDADERISPELAQEIADKILNTASAVSVINGYYLPRKTWYLDRWVKHSGWYPNYLMRLSRRKTSKWTEPALHEALQTLGETAYFQQPIEHYSFPDQRAHILKNIEYADHAKKILVQKNRKAKCLDFTLRPVWKFFDIYFLKLGFLDGKAGFFIAVHSAYALFLRYTYLYEQSLENSNHR